MIGHYVQSFLLYNRKVRLACKRPNISIIQETRSPNAIFEKDNNKGMSICKINSMLNTDNLARIIILTKK